MTGFNTLFYKEILRFLEGGYANTHSTYRHCHVVSTDLWSCT